MVTELTDFNRNMMLSIDVVPVPTDEAVREVENRLLGVPGSGKSFSAKELIAFLILNTEDDVLICDPENEFGALAAALGEETATVIHMAAVGKDRLNAMYMVDGYGENNPIVEKSQFIMSLVEQIDRAGVARSRNPLSTVVPPLYIRRPRRRAKPPPSAISAINFWNSPKKRQRKSPYLWNCSPRDRLIFSVTKARLTLTSELSYSIFTAWGHS